VITRVLPPEEWHKLSVTDMTNIGPAFRPEDVQIVVVEDEGRIVATLGAFRVCHLEGLWIDPEYRGNAGMARKLMKGAVSAVRKWNDEWAYGASGTDHMNDIMQRMGGVKMPVETFVIPV